MKAEPINATPEQERLWDQYLQAQQAFQKSETLDIPAADRFKLATDMGRAWQAFFASFTGHAPPTLPTHPKVDEQAAKNLRRLDACHSMITNVGTILNTIMGYEMLAMLPEDAAAKASHNEACVMIQLCIELMDPIYKECMGEGAADA